MRGQVYVTTAGVRIRVPTSGESTQREETSKRPEAPENATMETTEYGLKGAGEQLRNTTTTSSSNNDAK